MVYNKAVITNIAIVPTVCLGGAYSLLISLIPTIPLYSINRVIIILGIQIESNCIIFSHHIFLVRNRRNGLPNASNIF